MKAASMVDSSPTNLTSLSLSHSISNVNAKCIWNRHNVDIGHSHSTHTTLQIFQAFFSEFIEPVQWRRTQEDFIFESCTHRQTILVFFLSFFHILIFYNIGIWLAQVLFQFKNTISILKMSFISKFECERSRFSESCHEIVDLESF